MHDLPDVFLGLRQRAGEHDKDRHHKHGNRQAQGCEWLEYGHHRIPNRMGRFVLSSFFCAEAGIGGIGLRRASRFSWHRYLPGQSRSSAIEGRS